MILHSSMIKTFTFLFKLLLLVYWFLLFSFIFFLKTFITSFKSKNISWFYFLIVFCFRIFHMTIWRKSITRFSCTGRLLRFYSLMSIKLRFLSLWTFTLFFINLYLKVLLFNYFPNWLFTFLQILWWSEWYSSFYDILNDILFLFK